MTPDERVFRSHLEQGPFQSGLDRKKWGLISIEWPQVLIGVSAAPRPNSPHEYILQFDCSNYPQAAPTARLWDFQQNRPLPTDQWPTGRRRIPQVFRSNWKNGQSLYLPCDRIAIEGHGAWQTKYPSLIWSADKDITLYLRTVYDLLNSEDYTGMHRA